MATVNEVYIVALENRNALNMIKDLAKETEDFPAAGTLVDSDVVRISRNGDSQKTTVGDIKAASGGGDTNVRSDWNETDSNDDAFILNKPTNLSDFNNDLPPVDVSADAYSPLDTGVITGGVVTVNGGNNALVDISAGTGILMDWTDPANPIRHMVSWTAFTGEAMPDLGQPFTNLYIGQTGNLIKVSGVLSSPETRRSRIKLQTAEHQNGIFVSNITGSSRPAYQVVDGLLDYVSFLGALNSGNLASANGSNLYIDKNLGQTCDPFINRINDPQNPTILDNPAVSQTTFFYVYRDGVGGFNIVPATEIDNDNWDDGSGTLQNVGGNDYTIQRFYYIGSTNQAIVTYGQEVYSNITNARRELYAENPVLPGLISVAVWTTAMILRDNNNDLSNTARAEFIDVSVPGAGGGGGGEGDMTKAAYDVTNTGNSVDNALNFDGRPVSDFVLEEDHNTVHDGEKILFKYPGNVGSDIEVNDIIKGWWSTTLFIKEAQYNGGDDTLLASYTIIDSIEF